MIAPRTGWIGVDVGSHSVKLAQLERVGGELRLREARVIRRWTPWELEDPVPSAPLPSSQEVAAGLALGNRFRGRRSACVAPMRLCEIASCTAPPLGASEQRAAVSEQLDAFPTGGSNQFEFDFWDTEGSSNQHRQAAYDVNVMSIPTPWSLQVANDLSRAGLSCQVLDGLPLTLARAIELTSLCDSAKPVAALDWGYASATFCVALHGRAMFARRFRNCGLASIINAVRQSLTLSIEETSTVLHKFGMPHPEKPLAEQDNLSSAIADVSADALNQLCVELDRTLDYLKAHRRTLQPSQLLLFGGGAMIRNIAPLLAQRLALKVAPWRLPDSRASAAQPTDFPLELLGPAVALSALAWTSS